MATQRISRMWPSRVLAFIVVGLSFVAFAARCEDAEASLEYRVKAAFLLNFTKFIEWPPAAFADSAAPFTVCILGKDPFGQALDEVAEGERVAGRRLVVRRIDLPPAPRACQLIFINEAETPRLGSLANLGPVLTVGEGQLFMREAGIIAFVIDNHRVRFEINQAAAERAQLKLSSKLLRVARSVQR